MPGANKIELLDVLHKIKTECLKSLEQDADIKQHKNVSGAIVELIDKTLKLK